uniref:Mitochondrial amidoxime reducing component 1 n=1 Tax=Jaculus jaculus TaxID=51337 RepID=A0A8C5JVR0_JACJA
VAALGLAALALGAAAWHRRRSRRPRRLQQVGTVSKLWIYPIKSCKGVSVSSAECTAMGLRCGRLRDRYARPGGQVPPSLTETPGDPRPPPTDPGDLGLVHGLEVQGRDCGDAAAGWITSFLKTKPYRLVSFEPHMQPRHSQDMRAKFQPKDQVRGVAYSDVSPFLVVSEASLADLNSRLEKKVTESNFRANIVISGCGAYAEDSWSQVLIGDVELKRVMACSRCILTTVDPDTGVMDRKEPLDTLTSYRLCDPSEQKLYGSKPLFGQYFVLENPGTIKVGDPVYLLGQ